LASGDGGGGVLTHHAAFHPFHIFFIRSMLFLSVRTFFIRPYFFLSVGPFFYRFRPVFIRSVAFLSVAFLSVAFNRAKISQS
jgi:hypothetical protein